MSITLFPQMLLFSR